LRSFKFLGNHGSAGKLTYIRLVIGTNTSLGRA
jgi:hypothetical protein